MGTVSVVCDSTNYMPASLITGQGIQVVSLYVNWTPPGAAAPVQQRESDLPDFDAFYESLRSGSELPTTSQPSVGDFLEVYEPLVEAGHDIVSVHISGGISGTVASAEQARDTLVERGVDPARIAVVDSKTACAGMGQVALAAANAARAGEDVAACVDRAQALRRELKTWFALDTLEFLRRGGRIGAAAALLGTTLRIKPILTIEEEISPIEKVRTSARAFERMVEYLRSRHENGCDAWFVQHIQAHDQAAALVERGREIYGYDPEFVSEMGPVIGAHVGPGLLGVSGIPRRLLGPF
jgi:DegV family protein with EDD domain